MAVANYTVLETVIVALMGLAIIFAALTVLILLMKLLTAIKFGKSVEAVATPSVPPAPAASADMLPAKGSLGEIALYGVDDKTAALVMAIVADELQTPLNQLRFRSIREREGGTIPG